MHSLMSVSSSLVWRCSALLTRFYNDRSGSTVTEYALIATLIAVTIIGAVTILGGDVGNLFNDTANAL